MPAADSNPRPLCPAWLQGSGEMRRRIAEFDWSRTSLGPIAGWPEELRTALSVCLDCAFPVTVLWGREALRLYNDACIAIVRERHPEGLGVPWRTLWPGAAAQIDDIGERVFAGQTVQVHDRAFALHRTGAPGEVPEQVYLSFSASPIRGAQGEVLGIFLVMQETTERVYLEQDLASSAARLRRLFQAAPGFMATLQGPEHRFDFANDAYVRLVGRQVVGKTVAEAFPEVLDQGFGDLLDRVFRTGEPFVAQALPIELSGAGAERQQLFLDFVYQPITDKSGAPEGIFVQGYDVTPRVLAERRLEASRKEAHSRLAELETLYQTAPVALALLSAGALRYLRVNSAQAAIIGRPIGEILGRTVADIAPEFDRLLEPVFARVRNGEQVRDVEQTGELPGGPGEPRSFLLSFFPVQTEGGAVEAISCFTVETTEQRKAERAMIQTEKLAAVGRLAASIAHEINNPLESVTNLLWLARHSTALGDIQEHLDLADRELRRVALITSQTLRFHRQATRPREVSGEELLRDALGMQQGRIANAGVHLVKRYVATQGVVCFDNEIRQVLNNLIGNAIDAMQTGGQLCVRSRDGRDWRTGRPGMVLTVADTGPGMSEAVAKRIFEPFFTTKGESGTGLGLWVSSEIVQRHGGVLRVRSSQAERRHGTVFTLFLPLDGPVALVR